MDSNLSIAHCVFEANSATLGGSIFCQFSSLNITTTRFLENQSKSKGGVLYLEYSSITVDDTTFSRNQAKDSGGSVFALESALEIKRSVFYENRATLGGGIYATDAVLLIHGSTFENNSASESGGGLFVKRSLRIHFSNSTFSLNHCEQQGGGLHGEDLNLVLKGTSFRTNSARKGGGLSIRLSNVTISGSSFSTNSAMRSGGSMYLSQCGNASILSSSFSQDSADDGGSISATQSTFFGSELSFNRTSSANRGSAFCVYTSNFTLETSGIYQSTLGSYIALSTTNCTVFLNHVEFRQNNATCLSMFYSNVTIQDSLFESNTAEFGGMQFVTSHVVLRESIFPHNNGGRVGQVYLINKGNLTVKDSRFFNNSAMDGGAVTTERSTIKVKRTRFILNRSTKTDGGAISCWESYCSVVDTLFQSNRAEVDGGGFRIYDSSSARISNSKFINNSASGTGRGLYGLQVVRVVVQNVEFHNNSATLGGGGVFLEHSNASIVGSLFLNNTGVDGGCIHVTNTSLQLRGSRFDKCKAQSKGGGIQAEANSNVEILKNCTFVRNKAESGGAFSLLLSNFTGTGSKFDSNEARNGGAIYSTPGTLVMVKTSTFERNKADQNGGGIYLTTDDTKYIVCLMQDTVFKSNKAQFGGAFHFERRESKSENCTAIGQLCSGVALINTTFVGNEAQLSGAAIQTNNVSSIRVDCEDRVSRGFMSMTEILELPAIDNQRNCSSWRGNQVTSTLGSLGTVGSYARRVNITFNHSSSEHHGQVIERLSITNVKSGDLLPVIHVVAVDEFGNGPAFVNGGIPEAVLYSIDGFFPGEIPVLLKNGTGTFQGVAGFKPPGTYLIRIRFNNEDVEEVEIQVQVRECVINEKQLEGNVLCEACDSLSYNFEPKNKGCTSCPKHGDCSGRFIVPKSGYWHSSPCSNVLRRCLNEEACKLKDRKEVLVNTTEGLNNCTVNQTMAQEYSQQQCKTGYTGVLCGACDALYGRYGMFNCGQCLHYAFSLLFILITGSWLLLLAVTVIRGSLPSETLKRKNIRVSRRVTQALERTVVRSISADSHIIELVSRRLNSPGVLEATNERGHKLDTVTKAQQVETTKLCATESFKITVNYLQVIAIAATLNVVWTDTVSKLLVTAENLGGLTTEAVTGSVDCLLSSSYPATKSFLRVAISMLVPLAVCILLAFFWTFYTIHVRERSLYLRKRVVLSAIVVLYISYLGLTKLLVKVFYCIDVHDLAEYGAFDSTSKYWAMDTSIKCYEGNHVSLIVAGVTGVVLIVFAFPCLSAFISFRAVNHKEGQKYEWIFESMNFMYRAFDRRYIYWESVILARKAVLSIIAVFSYQLGGDVQSILSSVVLVLALFLHMSCRPYKRAFSALNTYEAVSLLVSAITFMTGQFFEPGRCGRCIRITLSTFLLTMNVIFFLFMLSVSAKYGIKHLQTILEHEQISIPKEAKPWTVLKVCMISKLNQWKHACLTKGKS